MLRMNQKIHQMWVHFACHIELYLIFCFQASDDDFEVVPQDDDDDVTMWDVEGENEDELKQEKIKSMSLVLLLLSLERILTFFFFRAWPRNG